MLCLLIRIIESKGYLYQYLPLLALASIAGGTGLTFAIRAIVDAARLPNRVTHLVTPLLVIIMSLYFFQISTGGFFSIYREFSQRMVMHQLEPYQALLVGSVDQANVARYLHENTVSTDSIQTWGTESLVYYAARRVAATRFVSTQAFWCSEAGELRFFTDCSGETLPLQEAFKEEFLDGVTTARPVYIVAHYEEDSLAAHDGSSFAPDFPKLRQLIEQDYDLETTIGMWSIFRLR